MGTSFTGHIGHTYFSLIYRHIDCTCFIGIVKCRGHSIYRSNKHIGHTSFTKIDEVAPLSLMVSKKHEIRRYTNSDIFKYNDNVCKRALVIKSYIWQPILLIQTRPDPFSCAIHTVLDQCTCAVSIETYGNA